MKADEPANTPAQPSDSSPWIPPTREDWSQLLAELASLTALVASLTKENEDLKARLGINSSNSSLPPSKDPPGAPAPVKGRKKSQRQRGGQPGHEGHHRELLPPERVDQTIIRKPEQCRRCHAPLTGTDPAPRRHQVTEIPEPRAVVTEWQLHELRCQGCGATTCAELPAGVSTGAFGPRLQAMVGLATGEYHLSARLTQDLLTEVHQVPISLGSINTCQQAVSEAIAAPVAEAHAVAQAAAVKNADETGWSQAGKRAWLWVIATSMVTVFMIHAKRSGKAAKALLGTPLGILVTDRWSAYSWWPLAWRQLCWAHLKRDFQKIFEASSETRALGRRLLAATRLLFRWWRRVGAGTMSRAEFQERVRPLRQEVLRLLKQGAEGSHKKVAGMCRAILKLEPAMWTFVEREGVCPTNNFAERQIRPAVLWRKGSFGTQSENGSLYVARIMTVTATLRQQGRSVLEYLTEACRAANAHQPAPSLLVAERAVAA